MSFPSSTSRHSFSVPILPFVTQAPQTTAAPSPAVTVPIPASVRNPRELGYRLAAFILLGDFVAAFLAILTGLEIRSWQRSFSTIGSGPVVIDLNLTLMIWAASGGVIFIWFMLLFGTYEPKNLYRITKSSANLVKSSLLCAATAWAYIGLSRSTDFAPRVGVVYSLITLVLGVGLWRLCSFAFLISPKIRETVSSRILVIGWNEKASGLRRSLRQDLAQLGEVVGCVLPPVGTLDSRLPPGVAILGAFSELPQLVVDCQASSIILADLSIPVAEIHSLISYCQREMIGFQMIPEYFPALHSGLQVQTMSGVSLLGVNSLPLDLMINRMLKRMVDIVGASIGLVAASPIIAIFSVIVYLESPGPIIYQQRRTSRNGFTFLIYKIRSMRVDAESSSGAVWCKQDDARRLRIGAFMRRWNIDELPQFWNVIKGDMSLVGPRPERPELIAKFKGAIPNYNARHEVRSGLTGWAQIKGLRGDTDLGQRIEADLFYLENWSLGLDFFCILSTFFKTKNAM